MPYDPLPLYFVFRCNTGFALVQAQTLSLFLSLSLSLSFSPPRISHLPFAPISGAAISLQRGCTHVCVRVLSVPFQQNDAPGHATAALNTGLIIIQKV